MGMNRIGEDIQISGTVSSPGFYGSFIGDGSGLTNLPGGGGGGTASSLSNVLLIGNTASTSIDMKGNSIIDVTSIESKYTYSNSTDGVITYLIPIETINLQNMAWLTLMYNT